MELLDKCNIEIDNKTTIFSIKHGIILTFFYIDIGNELFLPVKTS